ncbi:MAG: heterodisulfide reductase-related iron-sulfur binding cluster [Chitinispirillia bacterium]
MITREIGWNSGMSFGISVIVDMFIVIVILAIIVPQFQKRLKLWKIGKNEKRSDKIGKRIYSAIINGIFQKSGLKQIGPGIIHAFLFWGFIVLFIGTSLIFIQEYLTNLLFGYHFLKGNFYLFFSFCMDIAGILAIIAVIIFAVRRYVLKPSFLDNKPEDIIALSLLFSVLVSGFLVEAGRIAVSSPPFERWSFVGWAVASILPASKLIHRIFWWIHIGLSTLFMVTLFSTKFRHIFLTWSNQFFQNLEVDKKGAIQPISKELFETAESFGIAELEDMTWKQIFDGDACIRCGRCQMACPASQTEKVLSPKELMQKIKSHWIAKGPNLLSQKKDEKINGKKLTGKVITPEEIWDCTNCRSCEEVCPAFIEHVSIITQMRQNLVMVEGNIPVELQDALTKLENQGNPWGLGNHTRADWAKDLNVPLITDTPDAEILLYLGCAGSFADRNQKVSVALVNILQNAGIKFATLGNEEPCCGDPARRAGNEYLFQIMAETNIELFKSRSITKILTPCPHCFHMFKKEYAMLGARFEVVHHSDYLNELINTGRLKIKKTGNRQVTYHDSCLLGRYNNIYGSPRSILNNLGYTIYEMKRHRENSFCCGAGGARMWMEEDKDKRVNIARSKEAIETGAEIMVTACPYCMTMFKDGLDELDPSKKSLDIAECIEEKIIHK